MFFEQRVGSFYRAGIGLVTSAICLVLLSLIGFVLWKGRISFETFLFCSVIAILAAWFGKLSYQLIFRATKQDTYLLSPFSILCIFSLVGVGVAAGTIYRFSTGNLEKGLFGILIFVLLVPAGNYCYQTIKKRSRNQNGT